MSSPKKTQEDVKLSNSKQIWESIKDKPIDVFAMPAKVSDFCSYLEIDDVKCYLTYKASAVLPALESLLGADYKCGIQDKYLVIEKV